MTLSDFLKVILVCLTLDIFIPGGVKCGVSSRSSSGSWFTAKVTILIVSSNQAKTKLAGAIFQRPSLWFLLAQTLHYLLALFPETLWIFWGTIHHSLLSPQDVAPLSYSNPQDTALMKWEPPSSLKTPAWRMSPPTMRFHTWIGETEGSPR